MRVGGSREGPGSEFEPGRTFVHSPILLSNISEGPIRSVVSQIQPLLVALQSHRTDTDVCGKYYFTEEGTESLRVSAPPQVPRLTITSSVWSLRHLLCARHWAHRKLCMKTHFSCVSLFYFAQLPHAPHFRHQICGFLSPISPILCDTVEFSSSLEIASDLTD